MTVLHVIDHMGLGGAQRAVINHLNAQPLDKIFILRQKRSHFNLDEYSAQTVYQGTKTPFGYLLLFPRLLITLYRHNYQILHCHLRASWFFGLLSSRFTGGKTNIIFHERGWILEGSLIYRWLTRACANRGKIVAVSSHVALNLTQTGIPAEKIQVVHNGIDLNDFYEDKESGEYLRNKLGIANDQFLVGFASRWIGHKGWKDFLAAVQLSTREFNLTALIAGGGPDSSKIEDFIGSNKLSQKVTILKFFSEMRSFYNALDIFIFPSHWEPLGRSQTEAQACGTPVIASDIPGITELIDSDNAYLISPHSPQQIFQAISILRRDNILYNSLRTNGLSNSKKYSLSKYMDRISKIYDQASN